MLYFMLIYAVRVKCSIPPLYFARACACVCIGTVFGSLVTAVLHIILYCMVLYHIVSYRCMISCFIVGGVGVGGSHTSASPNPSCLELCKSTSGHYGVLDISAERRHYSETLVITSG